MNGIADYLGRRAVVGHPAKGVSFEAAIWEQVSRLALRLRVDAAGGEGGECVRADEQRKQYRKPQQTVPCPGGSGERGSLLRVARSGIGSIYLLFSQPWPPMYTSRHAARAESAHRHPAVARGAERARSGLALLAGWRSVPAAAAIAALCVLIAGAPVALAGDEPVPEPRVEAVRSARSHAHRLLGTPGDLPAQETPTPDDDIPDVALTLGGASHTVDVAGYFTDSVIRYEVSASPNGIVRTSRSGTLITIEPIAAGSTTVTVTGRRLSGRERKRFNVTVSAMVSAPTATGSIAAATLTEGATHDEDASDYFEGEGVTYTAESSDTEVATVDVEGTAVTVTAVAIGSATVTVTATNAGGSTEQSFAVTVVPPAPAAVGSIEATTISEGGTHLVTASDYFSGEEVTYAAGSSDAGVASVEVDGAAVTVTAVAIGSATVTVTATNAGGSAEQAFAVTVLPPAPAELGSIKAATLSEGDTHVLTASDYFEGEVVAYTAESSDTEVATVEVEGAVVTLTAFAVGSATVTVTATNSGGSAEQSFAVTVLPPAPVTVGSIEAATLSEGATHTVTASDYFSGEGVTYGAESSDTGVASVEVDGAAVTVTALAAGRATVTVTATNAGGSAEQAFAVTVLPPAPATVGGIEAATLSEGETHLVTASEYFEGEGVTYGAESSDIGVATVEVEGAVVTLTALSVGSATVTVTATNLGGSAEQSFAVTVLPPAPTAIGSIEAATLSEGDTHLVTASDYFAGEGVTYAAESSDAAVVAVAVEGAAVTVTAVAVGSATVTVAATSAGGSAEQSFAVTVVPPAPTATGSIEAATLSEGETHLVTASDYFEGEGITYAAESSDAAVVAVAVDGAAVTVAAVAAGSATVTVAATNAGGSAEQSFAVTVVPPAPTSTGSIEAATLSEGDTHLVTASDYFEGEGVAYAAESSDAGVASVEVDGAAVTVTALEAGSATVTVTATNAVGSAEQAFAVTVLPPAPAELGSIKAATLSEGETHLVTASDYFEGEGIRYAAESSDIGVASVEVDGAAVTVTALAAGSATVTVTATNTGGSVEQSFAVTVQLPPVTLTLGGAAQVIELSGHFGSGVTGYDVSVSPAGGVDASISGSQLTLTALAVGAATVTVGVTSAGERAEHQFAVSVTPPPPTTAGSISALTLSEREAHTLTASDYFAGEGVTYGAESSDTGVATVVVDGAAVTVTAVAVGEAAVTITATNAGGEAEQRFAVTVRLPAVTLVKGGAAKQIELANYFDQEVTGYEVAVSPSGIVHVSRSGSQLTLTGVAAGSATVTVTATNSGGSAEQSFAVTVLPPAPTAIGSIEAATLSEGDTHLVTASDYFEGEGVAYAAESSDAEVATVEVDGAAVTVTALAADSATVTVVATNVGGSVEQSFAVTVLPPAPTAIGSIEVAAITEGETHEVIASDYFEGEGVTYAAESSDTAVATVEVEGTTVTVTALEAGSATVTVTAANTAGSAEQSFAVTVLPPAPTAIGSIEAATITEGGTDEVIASNYFEGDGVTYGAEYSDAGVASVEVSGAVVTVTAVAAGSATVTVTATNAGGSAEQSFAVTVLPPAPGTVGSIEAATISEGATHSVTASDYFAGEGVAYAAESSDIGVATVEVEGTTVTVTGVAAGSATVTVTATNAGGSEEQAFAITVLPPAPVTVGGIEAATLSEGGTHEVAASDYFEGEGVTYGAESSDAGVASVEVSGAAVTVTAVAAGNATVTVTATNAGGSAEQAFAVTVLPPAPGTVGSIEAVTLSEGDTHLVTASDYFEGEVVAYAAESSDTAVATVEVEGTTVTVTGVTVGNATVTVTATNLGGSAKQAFAVTVLPPAPVTVGSIEAATISEGGSHEVIASDYFEGEGVAYAAESSDIGVATVEVDGAAVTVTAVAAGSATVTVTATNSGGSEEQAFAVTVLPPAPATVGGIEAATLSEGETHLLTASDYFEGEGVAYAAESSDIGVATVEVDGAAVTVTAVAVGSATVTVTATNVGGSEEQAFAVMVLPPAPAAVGSTLSLTLTEGGDAHEIDLAHSFSGEVVRYYVSAVPGGIVHLWESGGRLTVTPLAAGSATVTVTATNAGGSIESIFSVTVKSRSPRALGVIPLTRITEGDIHLVEAAAHFDAEGATYAAQSSDSGVATVEVYGDVVAVTAVDAGFARITLTATDGIRSAQQDILVIVLPRRPKVLGSVADVALAEGEAASEIRLADYLDGKLVRYQATAVPGGVVHVWESGGRLRLTALAAGTATVTVRAVNGSGSAGLSFEVTVRPRAPSALAGSQAVTLTVGAEVREIELADHFSGMVARYEVQAVPGGIVHVWESGGRLALTPLSPGLARVTVTAENGSGSAGQDILVTVAPAAPVVLGAIPDAALTEGGAEHEVALADYFSGVIARYEAVAVPDGAVHVWESGGRLRLVPLGAGVATVTVTAANVSGSAGQVFAVAVAPAAPKTLGSIKGVTLNEGSEGWEIELADHFGGAVARYEAAAVPDGVVHVWESGGWLRLAPLAAGVAMVSVTAANDSGSSEQGFAVAVMDAAPRALGSIEGVTLTEGGGAREAELADYFGGTVARYEMSAVPAGVVHLWESGGRLTLTPLAAGTATVTVTASNAAGSAEQFVVVAVAPAAPRALGSIEGVTLVEGGAAREFDLDDYFAGEVAGYDVTTVPVTTVPGAIVHLWEADGRLWLTPLVAGAATVTVTATNVAGSAEQAVAVAVAPAAPRVLGEIAAGALAEGGEAQSVDLTDYFGGVVARYEVSADPGGVVHVWESDGRLALTPLAAGVATVTVTALNGSGSATQEFAVTVESPAAAGP